MNEFFSIQHIACTFLGYSMSWLELLATLFTIVNVWLAIRQHMLNWPAGLVAIVLSFLLFYQSSLYADAFLQIFFFVVSCYGWYHWAFGHKSEAALPVTKLSSAGRKVVAVLVMVGTLLAGYVIQHLNTWFPVYFPQPAAYPYPDSFVMVGSFAGQWLLAKKKLENWWCWIAVNSVAVVIYYFKDIQLFSLLYLLLWVMAVSGWMRWKQPISN